MINFIIQIIASLFIGGCFIYLAKRFSKNKIFYFCVGFFSSFAIRFIYLLIYGFVTDFKIEQDFQYNRNLSVLLSVMIPYILFVLLRKKLNKEDTDDLNINDIGKE